jgi:UDP-glucose 4-epimerase
MSGQSRTAAPVTGGSGFIGRALVRELEACGREVTVFDPTANDGSGGASILELEALTLALEGVDVVYHLAGVLGTTELLAASALAVDVNVKGTVRVLDACRASQVNRVFLCTKPNDWLNTYSITKRAGEDFGRLYAKHFGLDVRILRWLNVYGPGQKVHPIRKAVPWMILQALHGRPIEVFGSGEQPVDLIYVDDLARVTRAYTSLEGVDCAVRDTGLSVRITANELAWRIRDLACSQSSVKHLPMRPGEDEHIPVKLLGSPTACELAGIPDRPTGLSDGIRRTIDYYRHLSRDAAERVLGTGVAATQGHHPDTGG